MTVPTLSFIDPDSKTGGKGVSTGPRRKLGPRPSHRVKRRPDKGPPK
jgi:hypothetical protein